MLNNKIQKAIEEFNNSSIVKLYEEKGEKRMYGIAKQIAYSKTKAGKEKLIAASKKGSEKAAKLPTSASKLQGAKNGGKKVGGSEDGKKRMANLGAKYGKVYGGKFLPKDAGIKGKENLLKEFVCEKCGNKVNRGNYHQFHGKKCRELEKLLLLKLLPKKFTSVQLKEIAEKNGFLKWKTLNLLHETCPYTKCIKKGTNQFNPGIYEKTKKILTTKSK